MSVVGRGRGKTSDQKEPLEFHSPLLGFAGSHHYGNSSFYFFFSNKSTEQHPASSPIELSCGRRRKKILSFFRPYTFSHTLGRERKKRVSKNARLAMSAFR